MSATQTIYLGRKRMFAGSDEADFQAWSRFVDSRVAPHVAVVPVDGDDTVDAPAHHVESLLESLECMWFSCWGKFLQE